MPDVRKSSSFIWQGLRRRSSILQPGFSRATELADNRRHWRNLHKEALLQLNLNADLLDDQHGPYYTTAVNGVDIDHPNFNDDDPAPPAGGMPVLWQVSGSNVSGYVSNVVETFTVNGKLTVGGLIDPTGLVFTEQEVSPWTFAAGYGALYVKNLAPSLLVYVDDTGVETPLSREGTSSGGAATLDSASGTYLATGAVTVNLPATALLGLKKTIKNTNSVASGNNVTVGRNGHNIDGVAADDVLTPLQSATYIGDGTDWWKI